MLPHPVMLRLLAPVVYIRRLTTQDTELAGQPVAEEGGPETWAATSLTSALAALPVCYTPERS